MGHGKATPRQKMINMMYLVLTALLALNVSADILNAFVLIDTSLRTSKESIEGKIGAAFTQFEAAEVENPVKVKPYREKADAVKEKADAVVEKIHELQVLLVQKADGPEGDPHHIKKKDDSNVGGEVMILNGEGENLKKLIDEYREFLIAEVGDSSSLAKGFRDILNTNDMKSSHGEEMIPWVTGNFEHLPLIAVVTLMTKMQADIRNAESSMLSHLLTEIDAASLKFDKIAGVVSAPNSYLAIGEEYTAEIFTAAYESTKNPEIYLLNAPFDSAKYAAGEYKDIPKLDSTQIKDGKGVIKRTGGSAGTSNIYGFINMKMPSGVYEPYPFETKYQVVVPSFAVSPTKMNVFYIGVDNPVDISASGVRGEVSASISGGGSITPKGGGSYSVRVKKVGDVTITVNGDGSRLGSKTFRCKTVPDPVATVGGKKGGNISIASLKAQNYVMASLENFVFDLKFPVTAFTVSISSGGFNEDIPTTGAQIKPNQKALFNGLKRGSKVYFENIKCQAPDGGIRQLGSVGFTIQ